MAISYFYAFEKYSSEAEAQAAVAALLDRLQNNPTEWMEVKEITGSQEAGWVIPSTKLTDAEILNPDGSKTYMAYSKISGSNVMPLTATQLEEKRNEFRVFYGDYLRANVITKSDESTTPPTETTVTPTTDMSDYVS